MAAATALFLTPPLAMAQVRASERGTVSQTVDGTVIEVDYGRPRLRGRTAFGGVVHWGEMWTPGANYATTLRVSKDVRLNGQALPAGRYSVWIMPASRDNWALHLHKDPGLFHLERPKPADMFLTLRVMPITAPPVELLTFSFPDVRRDGATLQLQWGPTAVLFEIQVRPTAAARPQLARSAVAPYLGRYTGWKYAENGDSTEVTLQLRFENGRLRGVIHEGNRMFELVPSGKPHQFWWEYYDWAGPIEQELASPLVFLLDPSGRAAGFEIRGIEQPFWLRGIRTPG